MLPIYAEVILPIPLPNLLTYAVPDNMATACRVGCRVEVPMGKSKHYSGIVAALVDTPPQGFEIKEVIDIIDTTPVVNDIHLKFWQWMADYYMCTIGEVYRAALPSVMKMIEDTYKPKTEKFLSLHQSFTKEIQFKDLSTTLNTVL